MVCAIECPIRSNSALHTGNRALAAWMDTCGKCEIQEAKSILYQATAEIYNRKTTRLTKVEDNFIHSEEARSLKVFNLEVWCQMLTAQPLMLEKEVMD